MTRAHTYTRACRTACATLAAMTCVLLVQVADASAAGPAWAVQSVASPSNFRTSQSEACETTEICDEYLVTATNVGTAPSKGRIVIRDTLPPGMLTVLHQAERHHEPPSSEGGEFVPCTPPSPTATFTCETEEPVGPGGLIQIKVEVRLVNGTEPVALNHVEVEEVGGPQGAVSTSLPSTTPNTVDQQDPAFGPQDFAVSAHGGEAGVADTLAGDHPSSVTVSVNITTKLSSSGSGGEAVQEPRSEIVDLPLGMVGNPLAAAQCPESTLSGKNQPRQCPLSSQVGVVAIQNHEENQLLRVYNMVPDNGYPAMFAFEIAETNVIMPARVIPSSQGYVLTVAVPAIPRSKVVKITGLSLTFFGDPGAQNGSGSQVALFANPVDCSSGPLKGSRSGGRCPLNGESSAVQGPRGMSEGAGWPWWAAVAAAVR